VRFLGRTFLLLVGLLFAIPAGVLALGIGVVVEPAARELVAALGVAGLDSVFSEFWAEGAPEVAATGLLVGLWTLSAMLLILPPALVALIGEVIGTRSFVWYGLGCGALTAAVPWLYRGAERWSDSAALPAEGRLTALLFVTGAVAGLTYWLIAGRSAGRRRAPPLAHPPIPETKMPARN
jgi:hypothetical protein